MSTRQWPWLPPTFGVMTNNPVPRGDAPDPSTAPTAGPDAGLAASSSAAAPSGTSGEEFAGGDVTNYDEPAPVDTRSGKMGSAWITVVIGAVLLIVLLVFVLQNLEQVQVTFLAWQFTMPIGAVILFAAIIGALAMALLAAMRIIQLRHRTRVANRRPKARRR